MTRYRVYIHGPKKPAPVYLDRLQVLDLEDRARRELEKAAGPPGKTALAAVEERRGLEAVPVFHLYRPPAILDRLELLEASRRAIRTIDKKL